MSVLRNVPLGISSGRLQQASIRDMRPRLVELQVKDSQVRKIRAEKLGRNLEDSNEILRHQGLPYAHEIITTELISRHHDH